MQNLNIARVLAAGIIFCTLIGFVIPALGFGNPVTTYFEKDSRLDTPVTIAPRVLQGGQLFRSIERETGVVITTNRDSEEFRQEKVTVGCKQVSTRALLDAFTAFSQSRLRRTTKNGYLMLSPQSSYDKTFLPSSTYEAARYAAGDKFIAALKGLPKAEQDRIFAPDGIAFTSLAPALQSSVREMLDAANAGWTAEGDTSP